MISLIKAGAQPVSQPPAARASASGSTQHGDRRSRRQACCRERAGNGGTAAARMLSPVIATRRAPGRPRQHESGAHRGPISEGHRSMQPVCSVHFCSDAPPLLAWLAPSKSDQHDHDRAGVPRRRASMPVLGRVGERSGKQRSFLALTATWESAAARDREIGRRAGDQHTRGTFAPSGGLGLTVPDGSARCEELR